MPGATNRVGGSALGGSTLGRAGKPVDGIQVPGYDAAYYWAASATSSAIGQAAIGGRRNALLPTAGLLASPDQDAATVTVQLWWAFADSVDLVRVVEDEAGGELDRSPVRVSPLALDPSRSRRNQSSNPKARDALTAVSAGDANSALSRLTEQDTPIDGVTTAFRATGTSAGQVSIRADVDPASPVPTLYGFLARTSAAASSLGVVVRWYDASSTEVGVVTYPVTAAVRGAAASGWVWAPVLVATWPDGAVVGTVSYAATGMPAGGTLDVTARLSEVGADPTAGYFDGDVLGASWVGTPGVSTSALSPVIVAVDAEAPLDVPMHYELSSGRVPGFVARSESIALPAVDFTGPAWAEFELSGREALLTHPGLEKTVRVWVEKEPDIDRDVEQGTFKILGRRLKVRVSDSQRGGDEGELAFITETLDERRLLLAMLDDGSPLLLRAPAEFGHPPLWWLSFGKVTVEALVGWAPMPVRRIKAAFVQVDRPSAATRPLVA